MASGTTYPLGLTVAPTREHASLPLRIVSTMLVTLAFTIALGIPLLVSGVTGFNLWQGAGQSMQPTLYAGDFVITRDVPASELQAGDIIMYEGEHNHIMHRIVAIEATAEGPATFITRGDNNNANDPPVPESALVGKLIYEVSWFPHLPIDLSGTGLFVAEWLASVSLFTVGLVLRRNPSRPSRAAVRRSLAR